MRRQKRHATTRKRTGVFYALVDDARRDILARALAEHGGNRSHTAAALGIQRTYLLRLIRALRLKDYFYPTRLTTEIERLADHGR